MSSDREEKPKPMEDGADSGAELTVFVEQLLGDMVSERQMFMNFSCRRRDAFGNRLRT